MALFLLVIPHCIFGQEVPISRHSLKGPIKSIAFERVYVRRNGRNIGEEHQLIDLTGYDQRIRVVEHLIYGEGYSRTRFRYSTEGKTAEIAYFDSSGNPLDEPTKFKPKYEVFNEVDLCPTYAIRKQIDEKAKVETTYETCSDGSMRATTVDLLTFNGDLVRSTRTDSKDRSWESVCEYDPAGNIVEFRYTVSSGTKKYTLIMKYSDFKFDKYGNWTRVTGTSFISTRPAELIYQYNELRTFTYYEPIPSR